MMVGKSKKRAAIAQQGKTILHPSSAKKKSKLSLICVMSVIVMSLFLIIGAVNVSFFVSVHKYMGEENNAAGSMGKKEFEKNEDNSYSSSTRERGPRSLDEKKDDVKSASWGDITNDDDVKYHTIISTGCSTKQDWQSYVFFYHAMKSGQKGHVTRIASGCNDKEAEMLKSYYKEQIESMAPGRFHLHLTPNYARVRKGHNFKYFNKPFGVLHWLEHGLGYPNNTDHDDVIIILCDPDMMILRPFTNDFTDQVEEWRHRTVHPIGMKVEHGRPFAQEYGFGTQWLTKTDIKAMTNPNESPSPILNMSMKEASENYNAGPPYMATGRDFYKIVSKWAEFVPFVHAQYPFLLAEMFAYCLAAAHLQLPHQIAHSFMLSDVGTSGEAWKTLIKPHSDEDACMNIPPNYLPHTLHYCQRYLMGKWMIGKHKVPKDFISCESPLLRVPPTNIATLYNFGICPNDGSVRKISKGNRGPTAFMLCYMINGLNEAARYYKQHHCLVDGKTNYTESIIFHKSLTIDK